MDLYSVDPDKRYLEYTDRWGVYHKWTARGSVDDTNADNQCCEQTYIDRFAATSDSVMIAPTTENLNHQMATGRKNYWWWIDAIQMAMPVYAKYAKISGDRHYLDYAMDCYRDARDRRGLFNITDGLWWRDSVYKAPYKEPDGKNCYWSRGNGWVYAALVRAMDAMLVAKGSAAPAFMEPLGETKWRNIKVDEHFGDYRKDFLLMTKALLACQRQDGFWNVSLHDDFKDFADFVYALKPSGFFVLPR